MALTVSFVQLDNRVSTSRPGCLRSAPVVAKETAISFNNQMRTISILKFFDEPYT